MNKSQNTLMEVYELISDLDPRPGIDKVEEIYFEALTARFARIADIFMNKVLKLIFFINREFSETFIDRANLAEKLILVTKTDEIAATRDLRNRITHEYEEENIYKLYRKAIRLVPELTSSIEMTNNCLESREWFLT